MATATESMRPRSAQECVKIVAGELNILCNTHGYEFVMVEFFHHVLESIARRGEHEPARELARIIQRCDGSVWDGDSTIIEDLNQEIRDLKELKDEAVSDKEEAEEESEKLQGEVDSLKDEIEVLKDEIASLKRKAS